MSILSAQHLLGLIANRPINSNAEAAPIGPSSIHMDFQTAQEIDLLIRPVIYNAAAAASSQKQVLDSKVGVGIGRRAIGVGG